METITIGLSDDYGIPQGMKLADDWRILGDHRIELVIGSVGAGIWAGATKCVKVLGRKVGPFLRVTAAISIQHKGGSVAYAAFYHSRHIRLDDLVGPTIDAINVGAATGTVIGHGHGVAQITPISPDDHAQTVAERRAICSVCPSGMYDPGDEGRPDVCRALKCCNRPAPDPERYALALETGTCPRRHFTGRGTFTVQTPIRSGKMLIGETIIPTL